MLVIAISIVLVAAPVHDTGRRLILADAAQDRAQLEAERRKLAQERAEFEAQKAALAAEKKRTAAKKAGSNKPSQETDGTSDGPAQKTNSLRPGEHVTKPGYLAAFTEELLDKAVGYAVERDEEALQQIMATGAVIVLKGGLRVSLVDTHFFGGKVKIRPRGSTLELWVPIEAVSSN